MNSNNIKVLFVFVLVYAALYAMGLFIEPLQQWDISQGLGKLDYVLFLLPFPGFFFIYLLIPWLREELGFGNTFIYAFPVFFLIGSYFAFTVSAFYFYGNQATLAGITLTEYMEYLSLDYLTMFLKSSFIYFVLAGVGGWGTRVLIENFDEEAQEKKDEEKSEKK